MRAQVRKGQGSLANGSLSCLPSADRLCRGGHEVWQFRSKTCQLVTHADDYMVTENLRLSGEGYESARGLN